MELKNKVVLITGGARRIGAAAALAFAKKGCHIAVHYHRSKDEANALVSEIESMGVKALSVKADCQKSKKIESAVKEVINKFGQIDILVNNASVFHSTPINEVSDKDFETFFDINLKSYFYFARAVAQQANDRPTKIINLADSYAEAPAASFLPYGMSKGGVLTLTRGLAKTYAPTVLVNAICPGPILPPEHTDPRAHEKAIQSTLLRQEGSVDDITRTIIYLAECDYITGQTLYVDGGRRIK